jgi:CubicO group peptidase (beta-lactamase class C family)
MTIQFMATHDRTHADYQNQWNTLVPQGFRPISLSVYGSPASPLYAAVWVVGDSPPFAGIHGATAAQFQGFFDKWASQGYGPTILTATGPAADPVFACVMEKSSHGVSLTRHGLASGEQNDPWTIEHWIDQARENNWIPRWVAMYGEPASRRYAIVLDPNETKARWDIAGWWGESDTDYQARFDAQVQQWARPAFVTVSPDARYLSVFREDSLGPWVARHNMTSQQYQQEFNTWTAQGMFPVYVQAGGVGSATRFAALFATRDTPYERKFTITGPAVPPLAEVDAKVEAFMKDNGTRATGVAVTRGGRLVFARGYTWGEPDYPVTEPTSMFRVASCSKPITSIAIHQLIERQQLALSDKAQPILGLQPPSGSAMDPQFGNITILHLLTHTGGWGNVPAPEQAAADYGITSLPVSKQHIAGYMASQPPLFAPPGAGQEYSNLGYLLLGLVIERRLNLSYVDAVKRDIFKPLGLTRPHRTPVAQSAQQPGAVRQHQGRLVIVPSAVAGNPQGARPLAPLGYGGEDYAIFDAFGGWAMAPVDYAKILAAFALGAANPLLEKPTVDVMWTVPSIYQSATGVESPSYTNGWDSWSENGVRAFQHGGWMPGVNTQILYRTDGWGFAVFCNSDDSRVPDIYPELRSLAAKNWPKHDLFPQFGIPAFPRRALPPRQAGVTEVLTDLRPAHLRGGMMRRQTPVKSEQP